MPSLSTLADQQRAELLQAEGQAVRALTRAYGVAWQRIQARLDRLQQKMADARARGETVSPSWLLQQERLASLQQQIALELRAAGLQAASTIAVAQTNALLLAEQHAPQLMSAALGTPPVGVVATFTRLPREALGALVGLTQAGTPLLELLGDLAAPAAQEASELLIEAVVLGLGPRETARMVRKVIGAPLSQALTFARTATLGSYRAATLTIYQANSDVVTGWIWHAQLGPRTCALCWAMHGTEHALGEPFAGHFNCRCAMLPRTKTWRELGYDVPETRAEIPTGAAVFAELSADAQLAILGPGKFARYAAGKLTLAELVTTTQNARWGAMRTERPLYTLGER